MRARAAVAAAVLVVATATMARAQFTKPPNRSFTRPENWGIAFGLDLVSPRVAPSQCPHLFRQSNGEDATSNECEDWQSYGTRGFGVSINVAAMLARHIILGGEAGSIAFGGDRKFTAEPDDEFTVSTTNSITGSIFIGGITSPIGNGDRQGRKLWLGGLLGMSKWGGERLVRGCKLCDTSSLPMSSAGFVQPFVMFGGGDADGGGGLRLSYRQYFIRGKAMRSSISLGLFFALGRL